MNNKIKFPHFFFSFYQTGRDILLPPVNLASFCVL
jgi:hypothetical protein